MKKIIYTIGTSARKLREFIETLKYYEVERVIDVRHFPTSSRFPHFKRERLNRSLPGKCIDYIYLGEKLGGYRPGGYEAHMKTPEFEEGIRDLEKVAGEKVSAFFCAEKLFWRCHRGFIADALIKRGWEVHHIIEKGKVMKGRV
ncbi:MAG: DUF488 family protein [Candidatus Brocadia sp.]